MKYDGYNVDWYDYTSAHDGGKRYGVKIEDVRRFAGETLSGFASIPERDAAVREWIERQEQKPVIMEGPVVRNIELGRMIEQGLKNQLAVLNRFQASMRPRPRDWYDDDANYEHAQRIYRERFGAVTELIVSYQRELGVIQEQLKELEKHGG